TLNQLAVSLAHPRAGDERANGDLPGEEERSVFREHSPVNGHQANESADIMQAKLLPRVILSVCLTGFGSAAKIAELIEEHMPGLRQQGVEIICMDISFSSKTADEVQRLVGKRHVTAVVGTIN